MSKCCCPCPVDGSEIGCWHLGFGNCVGTADHVVVVVVVLGLGESSCGNSSGKGSGWRRTAAVVKGESNIFEKLIRIFKNI
jgi:hypothetical protein